MLVSGLLLAEDEVLVPGPLPQQDSIAEARPHTDRCLVRMLACERHAVSHGHQGMVRLQYMPLIGIFSAAPPGFPQVGSGYETRPRRCGKEGVAATALLERPAPSFEGPTRPPAERVISRATLWLR